MAIALTCAGQARAGSQEFPHGPVASPKGDGTVMTPMRQTKHIERMGAAIRAKQRRDADEAARKAAEQQAPQAKPGAGVKGAALAVLQMALAQVNNLPPTDYKTPNVDLYAHPNWALSKLPTSYCSYSGTPALWGAKARTTPNCDAAGVCTCQRDEQCPGYLPPIMIGPDLYPSAETCTGYTDPATGTVKTAVAGTGIRKFVDTLPGLCPLGTNSLGDCLPLAQPDTATFPGSDYYEIGLRDYDHKFHSDLVDATGKGSKQRGYYQKNSTGAGLYAKSNENHYLGPIIVAQTNKPVRLKFVNEVGVGAAGNLFIPVDTTVAGMGVGPDGTPYTQNRATIHLHGGNTPWISDGTQHQWTTPVGENTTAYKKGHSVEYVPDMWFDGTGAPISACSNLQTCAVAGASNNPGDGQLSFYWPNQQSGRLLFYHDHAYGITRLNVHAGEAAGYLLVNPADEDALAAATVPGTMGAAFDVGHMIPLVIQDKTFVPPAAQMAEQDRTWDVAKWGGENSVWYPHVYTPNQWPNNPDGSNTNPYGRWDYGPWFWPPQTSLVEVDNVGARWNVPLLSPCDTAALPPKFDAAGVQIPNTNCPSTPLPSMVPESFLDTPVVNGVAYPTVTVDPVSYRFQMLNAAQERNFNLSWFVADPAAPSEVVMVPADKHYLPGYPLKSNPPLCASGLPLSAVTGLPFGPDMPGTPVCWPQLWPVDGRQGGVPDPATAGPQWVQIGSEAGLLPAPALIAPQPVGYEQNKRNIVVLNVAQKGLFLGPAERADVVVDFSAYAGKTLILYNDAPAPVPAGDPRQDYYTGGPDLTLSGGSPTPLPGFGPNTRTVMQVVVRAAPAAPQAPLNVAAVAGALRGAFKASQPAPIVPEAAYNPLAYPGTPATGFTNTYLPINATSLSFTPVDRPFLADGVTPNTQTLNLQWKALHELFTTTRGRMDSLLAAEVPNTNWLAQTTIPFSNFDPTTEFVTDTQAQIWKVTHNGVDTHTIHFHLLNVQILNRVGWDGQIRAPDANELGWKEAVRMNPLEDIYLAIRPIKQNLPWPLPDKWRLLDVDRAPGTASQFTGVDIYNNPIPVTNTVENFGQEYVWHCHLLGHEEEDMLRAEVFVVAPEMPIGLTAIATTPVGGTEQVNLSWSDASKSAMFFTVQRADAAGANAGVFATVATIRTNNPHPTISDPAALPSWPGNVFSYVDPTASIPNGATAYLYRVRAEKVLTSPAVKAAAGVNAPLTQFPAASAWTAAVTPGLAPVIGVTPTALAFPNTGVSKVSAPMAVTVSNTGSGPLLLSAITVTGDFAQTNTCGATVAPGTSCTISVTFAPTVAGPRTGGMTIASNDPVNPSVAVVLNGTGVSPIAVVAPASLGFAGQLVATPSAAQTVTLSNVGTSDLLGIAITVAGANAADFTQTSTCGVSLPPPGGATPNTCTISVIFTPSAAGARSASISIASSDPVNPTLTVALAGTGLAPVAAVSPASLSFTQALGGTSAAQTATVSNTGTADLVINAISLAGANPGDFAIAAGGTCAAAGIVPANGSCTVAVTFAPTVAVASRSASLVIASSDPVAARATLTVALAGTVQFPRATLAPSTLTFLGQLVGTTSPAQTVTLTNGGTSTLTVNAVSIGGANAGDFAQTSACTTLAPAATCAISVTFTPASFGTKNATLTVSTNDPVNATLSVALTGTDVQPIATVTPASLAFPAQVIGTASAAQTVTLSNVGTAPLAITGVTGSGAPFTVTSACGASLANPPAGGTTSCAISVVFAPTAVGPAAGSITISTSDPVNPVLTVALSGTGTAVNMTPTTVAFGTQLVGTTSASVTIRVTNDGGTTATLSPAVLTGAGFTVASGCGATLAPLSFCSIQVRFAPTASAPFSGTVSLDATVGGVTVPLAATLSGTGVAPVLQVAPGALTFLSSLNVRTAAQTVTVSNVGNAPMTINNISVTGANAASFSRTNGCVSPLAAGASCTVTVTFRPQTATPTTQVAALAVSVAAPAVSQSVSLTGTVGTPVSTVSPLALAFGSVTRNTASAPQTVTVTNTGTGPLLITGISLRGNNPNQFAQTNTCPINGAGLAPGASCTASVTFLPTSAGAKSARLRVSVNAPATNVDVTLSGTGL